MGRQKVTAKGRLDKYPTYVPLYHYITILQKNKALDLVQLSN
jgi:hypothetical protein